MTEEQTQQLRVAILASLKNDFPKWTFQDAPGNKKGDFALAGRHIDTGYRLNLNYRSRLSILRPLLPGLASASAEGLELGSDFAEAAWRIIATQKVEAAESRLRDRQREQALRPLKMLEALRK